MQGRDTYKLGEFIFDTALFTVAFIMSFKNIVFKPLGNYSYDTSLYYLWATLIIFTILGIACHTKGNRNTPGLMANVIMGYGVFSVIIYKNDYPTLIYTIIVLAIIGVIVNVLLIWRCNKNKRGENTDNQLITRKIVSNSYNIIAYCLGALVLILSLNTLIGLSFLNPSIEATKNNNNTIDNNSEVISKLKEKKWRKLSVNNKMDIAQIIVNIEGEYLGLSNPIIIGGDNLSMNKLAEYNYRTKKIMIDINHLQYAESSDVLNSLLHECYHSCQDEYVAIYDDTKKKYKDNYILKEAKQYKKELNNYKKASGDDAKSFDNYYSQMIEHDARRYAELRSEDYLPTLNKNSRKIY